MALDFLEFNSRLRLEGAITAETALRIGSGRSLDATTNDLPVIKDDLGKPFIPGSSVKGVLRSRVEAMLRTLFPDPCVGACNPLVDKERCIPNDLMKSWRDQSLDDATMFEHVRDSSCLACRLFGSTWLASHVHIRDWYVDDRFWFSQYIVRDGVAIDRDTETAADGLLYSYEVVPAGARFQGAIIVENALDWQLGLLYAGLDDLQRGGALGGGASRGLGAVAFHWSEASRFIDRADLWSYLEDPDTAGRAVTPELIKSWRQALVHELRQAVNARTAGQGEEETTEETTEEITEEITEQTAEQEAREDDDAQTSD